MMALAAVMLAAAPARSLAAERGLVNPDGFRVTVEEVAADDPAIPRARIQLLAQQRVTGSILALDRWRGVVKLSSPYGPIKLHFPPHELRDVRRGQQVTAQYTVIKSDSLAVSRAYDVPPEARRRDFARGAAGGAGTTQDAAASGQLVRELRGDAVVVQQGAGRLDHMRGATGGAGTTQDLAASGAVYSGRRSAVIQVARWDPESDHVRGATAGVGTARDVAAGGRIYPENRPLAADAPPAYPPGVLGRGVGQHQLEGRVGKVDEGRRMLHVQTDATTLELLLPARALRELDEGDDVAVDLRLLR